jgi:serine/threonine protein kinase
MNNFEVGDILGKGAFSTVNTCQHRENNDNFAVKIIDTSEVRLHFNVLKEEKFELEEKKKQKVF